jgi:hypothetical protein
VAAATEAKPASRTNPFLGRQAKSPIFTSLLPSTSDARRAWGLELSCDFAARRRMSTSGMALAAHANRWGTRGQWMNAADQTRAGKNDRSGCRPAVSEVQWRLSGGESFAHWLRGVVRGRDRIQTGP